MKTVFSLLLLFCATTSQAVNTFAVTASGQTTILTSSEGYDFQVTTTGGDRFIQLVVSRPAGETWSLLLGVPQGQVLANGFYEPIPGNDTFDAYPGMLGAGFTISGTTNPLTGAMSSANTTGGSFTLSDLVLGPAGTVETLHLDFSVRAGGPKAGYLDFRAVPEPAAEVTLLALGAVALTTRRRR